jgi:hypothetical protein
MAAERPGDRNCREYQQAPEVLEFEVILYLDLRYELVQNNTTGCSKRKSWWENGETSGVLHADEDPAWKSD